MRPGCSTTMCYKRQQCGETLNDSMYSSNLITINDHHPTRFPTHGNPISPDLSINSVRLAANSSWKTHIIHNSDLLPITIDINTENSPPPWQRNSFTNFKGADWQSFTEKTEESFTAAPSTSIATTDENVFQKIINTVSKETVPSGYFKNFTPGLSPEICLLTARSDTIRATDPNDPEISQLYYQITSLKKDEATKKRK